MAVVDVAPPEDAKKSKHIPGEEGVWVFIFGDMMVFAVFFGVYLVNRGRDPELFATAQDALDRNLGAVNTLILLISSMLVVLAVRSVKSPVRDPRTTLYVLGAFACGIGFILVKAFEYHARIAAGDTPATNDFFMYYFVMTGVHLFHLVIGLVVLTVLWRLSLKPSLTPGQASFFEGGACFWHMVDLLWLVLFPLLFLVR